jgi:hypothetical protein
MCPTGSPLQITRRECRPRWTISPLTLNAERRLPRSHGARRYGDHPCRSDGRSDLRSPSAGTTRPAQGSAYVTHRTRFRTNAGVFYGPTSSRKGRPAGADGGSSASRRQQRSTVADRMRREPEGRGGLRGAFRSALGASPDGARGQAACATCSSCARASLGAISATATSTTACPRWSCFTVRSTASWSGPAEGLPDPAITGDPRPLHLIRVGDDHDALNVGEGALAPLVWIAGEAAGREAAGALAAPAHEARVGPDGVSVPDSSGDSAGRFAADVARGRGRLISSRVWRGGAPVARSASTARRAASSLAHPLLSVAIVFISSSASPSTRARSRGPARRSSARARMAGWLGLRGLPPVVRSW